MFGSRRAPLRKSNEKIWFKTPPVYKTRVSLELFTVWPEKQKKNQAEKIGDLKEGTDD